jgi:hypothetical protein
MYFKRANVERTDLEKLPQARPTAQLGPDPCANICPLDAYPRDAYVRPLDVYLSRCMSALSKFTLLMHMTYTSRG